MPLINLKINLALNWNNNCVMYGADTYAGGDNSNNRETTFKIRNTNLYDPIVTLSSKDNVNLTEQLNEGFKRLVYCNEYKSKIETKKKQTIKLFKKIPQLDSLFLPLMALLKMLLVIQLAILQIGFKETVTQNISTQE